MRVSHTPHHLVIAFDDANLVAHAGLRLTTDLARQLELPRLLDDRLDLGSAAGAPNPAVKGMTLISALLAGADCIDDIDLLRSGATAAVLGHAVMAPSTIGTFLRSFSWGHSRQLDSIAGELLRRAWAAGAGPGDQPLTFDIDSSICETYGVKKQGGSRFTYTGTRGYHPLLAIAAGTCDVLHSRLRGGNANTVRGAASFVRETVARIRAGGATGKLTMRTDSGFYTTGVVDACVDNDVRFSITVRLCRSLHTAIGALPAEAWTPIPYWIEGSADVAETTYIPFASKRRKTAYRLIVRRVMPTPGSQLALKGVGYTYHALITNRDGEMLELEADHRRHAEVENGILDLKDGMALRHMPSGRFGANAAWLGFNVIAHNLARWLTRLGMKEPLLRTKTLRTRLLSLPGRMARSGRQTRLHLPLAWPWHEQFTAARERIAALSWAAAMPA